jgi:hypothetical protein
MPFIQCKIEVPTFTDEEDLEQAIDGTVMIMVRRAVLAFATEANKAVPKRTGFAAGSLGNLLTAAGKRPGETAKLKDLGPFSAINRLQELVAQAHGQDLLLHGIDPSGFARKEYYYPSRGRRVLKTPASGVRFATPINEVIRREGRTITFQYNVDISYYTLQDVRAHRSPTSPWESFRKGTLAFMRTMDKLASDINSYPTIEGFLEVTTITVDAKGNKSSSKKVLVK